VYFAYKFVWRSSSVNSKDQRSEAKSQNCNFFDNSFVPRRWNIVFFYKIKLKIPSRGKNRIYARQSRIRLIYLSFCLPNEGQRLDTESILWTNASAPHDRFIFSSPCLQAQKKIQIYFHLVLKMCRDRCWPTF